MGSSHTVFFGFLRSCEITVPSESEFDEARHITFRDISVDCLDKPTTLRLRLKASKTDPFRVGVDVFVWKTGGPLCPVMAVLDYVVVRGARQGPLFHFRPLTRARFVERVRGALTRAGIDSTPYSGHSFRRQQQQRRESEMPLLRCWAGGGAAPISCM